MDVPLDYPKGHPTEESIKIYTDEVLNFEVSSSSDFILSGGDEKKKKAYIARHKINEDWNDLSKKGTWSRYILWNKKTLKDSINDMNKRFNINIIYIEAQR
mgnify:CR=1 FL=1